MKKFWTQAIAAVTSTAIIGLLAPAASRGQGSPPEEAAKKFAKNYYDGQGNLTHGRSWIKNLQSQARVQLDFSGTANFVTVTATPNKIYTPTEKGVIADAAQEAARSLDYHCAIIELPPGASLDATKIFKVVFADPNNNPAQPTPPPTWEQAPAFPPQRLQHH